MSFHRVFVTIMSLLRWGGSCMSPDLCLGLWGSWHVSVYRCGDCGLQCTASSQRRRATVNYRPSPGQQLPHSYLPAPLQPLSPTPTPSLSLPSSARGRISPSSPSSFSSSGEIEQNKPKQSFPRKKKLYSLWDSTLVPEIIAFNGQRIFINFPRSVRPKLLHIQ